MFFIFSHVVMPVCLKIANKEDNNHGIADMVILVGND